MLNDTNIACPYCGETLNVLLDPTGGSHSYIEDCQVCCRPIELSLEVGADGEIQSVTATRDDE